MNLKQCIAPGGYSHVQAYGDVRPNGLLFHQKSLNMGPGPISQKLRKTCKISRFEVEKPLEMGRGFRPRAAHCTPLKKIRVPSPPPHRLASNVAFSPVCYHLLCNYGYLHCLNHRETKNYVISCNRLKRETYYEVGHRLASNVGFSPVCYHLLCNHGYLQCPNHRETKD